MSNINSSSDETFLTTYDNPFDPFNDFMGWYRHDCAKGYNTCGIIDTLSHCSEAFSQELNDKIIESAMRRILELDVVGKYVMVTRKDYNNGTFLKYKPSLGDEE